jgi:hypothetical protein
MFKKYLILLGNVLDPAKCSFLHPIDEKEEIQTLLMCRY